jgi:menaquinone-dependent protoporphyrinogen oxidase
MTRPILVAYATKLGSTHEVAEAISARLREHGLAAECRAAVDVDVVARYDGVVLGGALYIGRWHRDARHFLRQHAATLAAMPVAIFGMGPRTTSPADIADAREQLERALGRAPDVTPVSVAVFGGVVDPTRLHFPFSHMAASDARDWDAIESWSDGVAAAFGAPALVTH